MLQSIFKKEWLKLRFYIFILLFITSTTLLYFWHNLSYDFATIEPESMMWYKFAHLSDKPYFAFNYLFLLFGGVIALAGFLPERIRNRIKIMAHLPLSMSYAIFLHLGIGAVFVVLLSLLLSFGFVFIMGHYYPLEVLHVVIKDMFAYSVLSVVFYFGISSVILEKNPKVAFLKIILVALMVFAFVKERYFALDLFALVLLLFIPFMVLDSFYTIKEQRLESPLYKISFVIVEIALLFFAYARYSESYPKNLTHYYIFYSNIIDDFVYQKNYEGHRFTYGIAGKEEFGREIYESHLPFVYFKDLEIQGKLPLTIEGKVFDAKSIKSSRLSLAYNYDMSKTLEAKIYPLLNPQTKEGVIKFPEEFFTITKEKVLIYGEHNIVDTKLSDTLTQELQKYNFDFNVKHIWGKTTNMKPFDKGYLVLDGANQLFNIKRANDLFEVRVVEYPKDIELAHINISENKQQILSGYAIDKDNKFYLLDWECEFIPITLEEFDYKTMRLQVIANPMNYLIRYNDSTNYYAVAVDKEFKSIKSVKLER